MATASPAAGIREWEETYLARPRHVRDARHAVEGFLSGCAAGSETLLICSELTTNSVLHSRSKDDGTEVIDHLGPWETPARVEAATAEWASWYNTRRVMRRTAGRPPAEYEQAWRDGTLGQIPVRGPGSRPRRPAEAGGHGRRS